MDSPDHKEEVVDELRERIAEECYRPTREELRDILAHDPGPFASLPNSERNRYLGIADRILALFGEPVAWGIANIGWPLFFDTQAGAEAEAIEQGGDARVVPLYALTSGSDE